MEQLVDEQLDNQKVSGTREWRIQPLCMNEWNGPQWDCWITRWYLQNKHETFCECLHQQLNEWNGPHGQTVEKPCDVCSLSVSLLICRSKGLIYEWINSRINSWTVSLNLQHACVISSWFTGINEMYHMERWLDNEDDICGQVMWQPATMYDQVKQHVRMDWFHNQVISVTCLWDTSQLYQWKESWMDELMNDQLISVANMC